MDLMDFTDDPRLMAHLNDCVIDPGPPMVARITYRFQPKAGLGRVPESLKPALFTSALIRRLEVAGRWVLAPGALSTP